MKKLFAISLISIGLVAITTLTTAENQPLDTINEVDSSLNLPTNLLSSTPRGWSKDYITMSSISEGEQNTLNYNNTVSRFATIPVQNLSIFTYANGGDDTWTVATDQHERILTDELTKVKKEIMMARRLEQETTKSVMPILVVYTSGGSASTTAMDIDFGFQTIEGATTSNLNVRLADLIKVCQQIQSYKDDTHATPATIILNPDFLGEAHKIYKGVDWAPDTTLHAINPSLAPTVSQNIALYDAVQYAYEAIKQPLPSDLPTFVTNKGNLSDYIQTINWIVKTFAPDVPFGWEDAIWAGDTMGHKWIHHPEQLNEHAQAEIKFLNSLNIYVDSNPYKPDFFAFDKYERDDFDGNANSLNNGYVYNIPAWNTYMDFIKQVSQGMGNVPMMIFQLQGGHLQTIGDLDSRDTHGATGGTYVFGDNTLDGGFVNIATYLSPLQFTNPQVDYNIASNDPSVMNYLKTFKLDTDPQGWQAGHVATLKNANIFAILWGGGNTTSIAGLSDITDDHGWLSQKITQCYSSNTCYFQLK